MNIANDSPIEATARKNVIAEFIIIWPSFLHIPQICKEQGKILTDYKVNAFQLVVVQFLVPSTYRDNFAAKRCMRNRH